MDDLTQSATLIPLVSAAIQQLLEGFGNPLYDMGLKMKLARQEKSKNQPPPEQPVGDSTGSTAGDGKTLFMSICGLVLGCCAAPFVLPHGLPGLTTVSPETTKAVAPATINAMGFTFTQSAYWPVQLLLIGSLLGAGSNAANSLLKYAQGIKTSSTSPSTNSAQTPPPAGGAPPPGP